MPRHTRRREDRRPDDPDLRAVRERKERRRKSIRFSGTQEEQETFHPVYEESTRPIASQNRMLGLDYGERRIGVAISDPAGRIAQGLDTLETDDLRESADRIDELARQYEVERIVIGLPVLMDGSHGNMVERVMALAETLREKTGRPVDTWDERLTSAAAHRTLIELGHGLKGNKKKVDRIAATMLLQSYLDYRNRHGDTRL